MRVLVTGATGFAGRPLVSYLAREGFDIRAAVRGGVTKLEGATQIVAMPDISRGFDAEPLVAGCNAVVHVAGLAHSSPDIPEDTYHAINCEAARSLALVSRKAGVQRFIYISSVRAQTGPSAPGTLSEKEAPVPSDAYGRSKLAGELAVCEALAGSATAYVILRPVLMYGPRAKGNMALLMRLARTSWPLPLGGFKARRSVLGIENFCSAVTHALRSSRCDGGTFLVADAAPVTAGEIIAAFRREGLDRPARLVPVPLPGMAPLLRTLGKRDLAARLFGDLVVSTDALAATGWCAPKSTAQGLASAIRD